ncbi:CU044_5270 family protein [Micromonospora sp. NPDC003776]
MDMTPNQPAGDDRDEVARLLPELAEVDLPGGRQRQLQEFLMSEIQRDQRESVGAARRVQRRLLFATAGLAAAAVAAVAVGTGALHTGAVPADSLFTDTTPQHAAQNPPPKHATAPAFELAAQYAAAQPYTPPRPDQWVYVKDRKSNPSSIAKDKGQRQNEITEVWLSVDGLKMAEWNPDTGKFDTWTQDNGYPEAVALPTDPGKLLDAVRGQLQQETASVSTHFKPSDDMDSLLFGRLAMILEGNVLPPRVAAALWRAIGMVPGATQEPGTVMVNGRPVVAVGRIQEGWRSEQLLLDAGTHEFVGYRSVAAKDHTFTSPTGPIRTKRGEVQFTITRVAAKFVDKAGQTG